MAMRVLGIVLVLAAALGVYWLSYSPPRPTVPSVSEPEVIGRFEAVERGALIATPAVTSDRIYVAAIRDVGLQPAGAIHCLDRATLHRIWSFDDGGAMLHMFSSPVVANGRLYVGEGMHANFACHLYCLDAANGKKLWAYSAKSHVESTPVVAAGRVYFGAGDDGVICLDAATGQRIWKLARPAHVDTTLIVDRGVVYAGSGVSRRNAAEPAMMALDAETGRLLWHTNFDLPVWATPALENGVLYVGLGNGRLLEAPRPPETPRGAVVALDAATGRERWRFDGCDAVFGAPAVSAGPVYAGSRDGRCYAFERTTGRRIWAVELGSPIVAAPVWAGRTLVVTASGGRLVGLDPTSGGIAWQFDVAAARRRSQPQLLSPPAVVPQDGGTFLYLPTELRSPAGSAATLFVLRP